MPNSTAAGDGGWRAQIIGSCFDRGLVADSPPRLSRSVEHRRELRGEMPMSQTDQAAETGHRARGRRRSRTVKSRDDAIRELDTAVRDPAVLSRVLAAAEVRALGRDGSLSERQRGLIATAVSLVQEDVIALLRQEVESLGILVQEERRRTVEIARGLASGALLGLRQAWRQPLISVDVETAEEHSATPAGQRKRPASRLLDHVRPYLNWGNFGSISAIILLVVAIFYTKAYASLKDRVENQQGYVGELEAQRTRLNQRVEELIASNGQLTGERNEHQEAAAVWKATAEASQVRIEELQ
jgi:hypothetical protein